MNNNYNDDIERQVVSEFWEYADDFTYDDFMTLGSIDIEEIVRDVISSHPEWKHFEDEIYETFYSWKSGLEPSDFDYDEDEDEKFFESQDRDYKKEARELFSYIKSSLEDEDFEYDYDEAINNADDKPFEYLCVKYGEDSCEDWYVGSGEEAIVDTCQDIRDILRLAKV